MSGKHVAFTPEENSLLRNAWREFVNEHQLTQKEAGDALGIRQQNAGRLTSALPNVGIGRRTANLIAVKLGYPDAEHFLREHGVKAEIGAKHAGEGWSDRDSAGRIALMIKIPEQAILNVVARYGTPADQHRPIKWWIGKFREEEVELAAEASDSLPHPIRPAAHKRTPSSSPRRRASNA